MTKYFSPIDESKQRRYKPKKRYCSRCGKKFMANSRYNKICKKCNRGGLHMKGKRKV